MASFAIPAVTVDHPHETECIVRRSRFLTLCAHTPGLAAARAFHEGVRVRYPDATHHCFACMGGAPGDTGHAYSSDDGEPHGTAGRPMLQILSHAEIGEIGIVVVRWFGGVKLGTGGLVRAYQDSVRENLATLPCKERKEFVRCDLAFGYAHADAVQRLVRQKEAVLLESDYGSMVRFALRVPKDDLEPFKAAFDTSTNGSGTLLLPAEDALHG